MANDNPLFTKRQEYMILRSQLESERSTFLSHWRDLGDYILPRRPRFSTWDVNRGDRRNQKIIDSTATLAMRTLRSGMMGGVTSPARPWFRLTTPDPGLADISSVKVWLDVVTKRMTTVFLRSNLYNVLPIIYGDIGCFGTSSLLVQEDFEDVVRFYPFPIGSYSIANNNRLKVDVFTRDFKMTVRQLIQSFAQRDNNGKIDWSNFSTQVKNMWDQGLYETWIEVVHVVQPNRAYDPSKLHSKFKKYSSCYFESGMSSGTDQAYMGSEDEKFLRESGYDLFPVLCPRWEVTGEDVYGTECPGMSALGDIKALQVMQKRKAQAVEKMVNPPMVGPSSLRSVKATILPGDITYSDEREGQRGFRPAHEVNIRINEITADIQDHQQRIRRALYEDLFLMLASSDRREITAREVDERHEEKLLALGPVLEQLNQDMLDPLIDLTFDIMGKQGLIPKPPDELQGVQLKVDYISVMAQAQKLIGISSIERFASFSNTVAQVHPEAADKVDVDHMLDVYGDATSMPPGIIRPEDEVQQIRQQRAQQAAAQQKAAIIQQTAGAAKDLSAADLSGDNALSELMNRGNAGSLVPQ
jgi:hypothetical protein